MNFESIWSSVCRRISMAYPTNDAVIINIIIIIDNRRQNLHVKRKSCNASVCHALASLTMV